MFRQFEIVCEFLLRKKTGNDLVKAIGGDLNDSKILNCLISVLGSRELVVPKRTEKRISKSDNEIESSQIQRKKLRSSGGYPSNRSPKMDTTNLVRRNSSNSALSLSGNMTKELAMSDVIGSFPMFAFDETPDLTVQEIQTTKQNGKNGREKYFETTSSPLYQAFMQHSSHHPPKPLTVSMEYFNHLSNVLSNSQDQTFSSRDPFQPDYTPLTPTLSTSVEFIPIFPPNASLFNSEELHNNRMLSHGTSQKVVSFHPSPQTLTFNDSYENLETETDDATDDDVTEVLESAAELQEKLNKIMAVLGQESEFDDTEWKKLVELAHDVVYRDRFVLAATNWINCN